MWVLLLYVCVVFPEKERQLLLQLFDHQLLLLDLVDLVLIDCGCLLQWLLLLMFEQVLFVLVPEHLIDDINLRLCKLVVTDSALFDPRIGVTQV